MAVTGITSLNSFAMNSANVAPHGAAFIPSLAQVWVPDNNADAFFRYSRDGTYVSRSNLDSGNGRPRGACFAMHGGNAHVVCVDANRTTYVYRTDGTLRGTINTTARLSTVEGVAWHNGSLYYADRGANQIVRVPPNSAFSGIGADPVTYPLNSANNDARGIAHISLASEFWVLQGTTVHRYSDSDLSYQGTFSLASTIRTPRALVEVLLADNSGQLWVADNANDTFYRHRLISRTLVPPVQVTGVTVTALSPSSLRVNWSAIAGVTDYGVSVDSGAWMSAGADDTVHILTGLDPSTRYSVRVRARNADGAGPASVAVTGQTQDPPVPSQTTGVTVTVLSPTSLRVNWTASTDIVTDYEVSVDSGTWMSAGADDTEMVLTGLTPITTYSIRVRARNSGGAGTASAAVTGQTQNTPNPVTLRFSAQRGIAGETLTLFIAFRDPATGFTASDINVTNGTKGELFGNSRSWGIVLTPTAGADGTLSVNIAADSVAGGNAAASASLPYLVRRTVTIAFNKTFLLHNEIATATITFSHSVTGLIASDFRLTGGGTLGTLTGQGTTYQLSVTAPATGAGTLTLTLPADQTTEPSGSADSSIDYAANAPLGIEAIDEQFITIGTKDYDLVIDITGDPDRVEPTGDFEGFYHDWDAANSQLHIKSTDVTRLIVGAVWTITLTRGTETLIGTITYNVVLSAPIIIDPGEQILYKGGLFNLNVDVANRPAVVRGSGLQTGLKYVTLEAGVNTEGRLPFDANLTESRFMSRYYAENDGGTDEMMVPVTIKTHTGVYVFDSQRDDLLKIAPETGALQWTYEAPNIFARPPATDYDPIVASPDGVYLFSDASDDLLKVSPDGDLLWTFEDAVTGDYGPIVVTDSGIYVQTTNNIYKVHPATGALIWESDIVHNRTIFHVSDGDVYVLGANLGRAVVIKLNGVDGTVVWTYESSWRSTRIAGVAGDTVYLWGYATNGDRRRLVAKINTGTGELVWTYNTSFTSTYSPVFDSSAIYVFGTANDRLIKINASDGLLAWTFNSPVETTPILDSDSIYLNRQSREENRLLKLNLNTGAQEWLVDGRTGVSRPIFQPNGIYYLSGNVERLTKVNKSTGSEDWSLRVRYIRFSRSLIEDGSDLYAVAPFGSSEDVVKLRVSDGTEQWRYETTGNKDFKSLALPDFALGA